MNTLFMKSKEDEAFLLAMEEEDRIEFTKAVEAWRIEKSAGRGEAVIEEIGGCFKTIPKFDDIEFLKAHLYSIINFYDSNDSMDTTGGFYHYYKDSGKIYNKTSRHLISSTKFVINYAQFAIRNPSHDNYNLWLDKCNHALKFLKQAHWNNDNKSYSWTINYDNNVSIIDNNNDCSIGLAFVLLSYSNAYMAGIDEAKEGIKETFDLLEEKYWESNNNLYADSYNSNGILQNYRGQNSNMHLVEAFISAFDATNDRKYLLKAYLIAESVTIKLSSYDKFNLICEHFSSEKYNSSSSWIIDNEYNKNNCFNENNFHPVGYQPGHLTEWSTLLIRLEDRIIKVFNDGNEDIISKLNTAWIVPRACELFDTAMINGWDDEYGGIICSFVENENNYKNLNNESIIFYDTNKYHWVQAASFSAAAVLFKRTCDNKYSEYYNKIWKYIWENFVDHVDGAWFCTLNQNNSKINNNKCPAGKVDYHSISSCHYSIDAFIS